MDKVHVSDMDISNMTSTYTHGSKEKYCPVSSRQFAAIVNGVLDTTLNFTKLYKEE